MQKEKRYYPDEEERSGRDIIIDIDSEIDDEAQRRAQRIRREVVRIDNPAPVEEEVFDEDEEILEAEEEPENEATNEATSIKKRSKSLWQHITTGSFFTDGAKNHYRYLIAIALMYFLSIFLSFISLNADREYRKREKYATVLTERSVLKEEERFSLSSKNAIKQRLKEYGIELIDLSKDSRLIEE